MNKTRRARFLTSCVQSTYELIHAMNDTAQDISRRTFLQNVNRTDLAELEQSLSYAAHASQGLTMAADWAVSYHRSTYDGRPCYFFRHSAIEYIFVEESNE